MSHDAGIRIPQHLSLPIRRLTGDRRLPPSSQHIAQLYHNQTTTSILCWTISQPSSPRQTSLITNVFTPLLGPNWLPRRHYAPNPTAGSKRVPSRPIKHSHLVSCAGSVAAAPLRSPPGHPPCHTLALYPFRPAAVWKTRLARWEVVGAPFSPAVRRFCLMIPRRRRKCSTGREAGLR